MLDPATVELLPPSNGSRSLIGLFAAIEQLPVQVEQPARVVVNEASGTVVMNADVRVSPVAVAQGGLTVVVAETPEVSQPGAFSNGQTAIVPRTDLTVDDGSGAKIAMIGGGTSLRSLVDGLNALGVSPRDLISILQAIRSAGALQAEIEVQ